MNDKGIKGIKLLKYKLLSWVWLWKIYIIAWKDKLPGDRQCSGTRSLKQGAKEP